jgi:hypothetical protein
MKAPSGPTTSRGGCDPPPPPDPIFGVNLYCNLGHSPPSSPPSIDPARADPCGSWSWPPVQDPPPGQVPPKGVERSSKELVPREPPPQKGIPPKGVERSSKQPVPKECGSEKAEKEVVFTSPDCQRLVSRPALEPTLASECRSRIECQNTLQGSQTLSCGVIAYAVVDGVARFLITKKRNTYEYISILRGHWKDLSQLKKLFGCCSRKEQQLLLKFDFDVLWKDLWIYPQSSGCVGVSPLETKLVLAKLKKRFFQLQALRPKLEEVTTHGHCIWEFPKGRKDTPSESDLECALREFQEETKISSRHLTPPIRTRVVEQHRGSDQVQYKTLYFVIPIDRVVMPTNAVHTRLRSTLSEEAKVCQWATLEECRLLLVHSSRGYESVFQSLSSLNCQ